MLFNQRMPGFILAIHVVLYYSAVICVKSFGLNAFGAAPISTGILLLISHIPYCLIGTKFLWWTFHDTDGLFAERIYNVPQVMYLTHFLCGCSLSALLKMSIFQPRDSNPWKVWASAFMMALASLVSAELGTWALYYGMHLSVGIEFSVCTASSLCVILVLLWLFSLEQRANAHDDDHHHGGQTSESDETRIVHDSKARETTSTYNKWIVRALLLWSTTLWIIAFVGSPEKVMSLSHHQTLGDCLETSDALTPLREKEDRRKYLCAWSFTEDFNLCGYPLSHLPWGNSWYYICGQEHSSYASFVWITVCFSLVAIVVHIKALRIKGTGWREFVIL